MAQETAWANLSRYRWRNAIAWTCMRHGNTDIHTPWIFLNIATPSKILKHTGHTRRIDTHDLTVAMPFIFARTDNVNEAS